MKTAWPNQRRLLGTKIPRVDGPDKATGNARYSFDVNRPGMIHARILRCPHAHARLKSIDTSAAEKAPGFRALHLVAQVGTEFFYAGEEIVGVACDTEDQCRDALRAIKVEFEVLDFVVRETDAREKDPKTGPPLGKEQIRDNLRPGGERAVGNLEEGWAAADAVHQGEYGASVISHQCLEPHGLVAEWDKDLANLTVWASTQAVVGTAQALANYFKLPPAQVKCITHYMGGGFGSKFGPDIQGLVCAELARKAKLPVKLMLERDEEITVGGNRPSVYGTVKIGGKKDGTLTAYEVDCFGSPGVGSSATVNLNLLPYVYSIPNFQRKHQVVRLNHGGARAMRAPGHPQNCLLTDCPIDDLAAKLGIDPTVIRLKNLPANDENVAKANPIAWAGMRHTVYAKQVQIAQELSKWKENWHPPGKGGKGPIRRGLGMALHTWGGSAQGNPNDCTVTIARDGSVTASTSTQDLGTGQRTATAIVVAEILGLQPTDVDSRIGESTFGRSTGSGGSTTLPSQAPAALRAALAAREEFLKRVAPKLQADPADLALESGKVVDKKTGKSWDWKQACARLGMDPVESKGTWTAADADNPETPGVSNVSVGGVQVAEVVVDVETGVVRCTHVVAVQDCGLIVNKLACESQVAGGVIMGLNYALFEECLVDRATGRLVNADMEFYKLGGIQDMPRIDIHMMDMPERGVIGIGEPPTISTAAAVSNAVFNALGVRVPYLPLTPDRVLAALAKGA
jgi:xanthine dehydrogenase YagR molybdenum-binding subunit